MSVLTFLYRDTVDVEPTCNLETWHESSSHIQGRESLPKTYRKYRRPEFREGAHPFCGCGSPPISIARAKSIWDIRSQALFILETSEVFCSAFD